MKKSKIRYAFALILALMSLQTWAQEKRTVTGIVSDTANKPLANVSVVIKGTTTGTATNDLGSFTLNVATGDTLILSALNYLTKTLVISESSTYNIVLNDDKAGDLGEVVVTALGIKRSERSLSYQTQEIKADQITSNKTDNFMNALNGKVAGVTISQSASGIGGSVKVNLRGIRSVSGSNQPLYVIDGVPINNNGNANSQPNSAYGGAPDGGDGISNLNPEDIASISVLEGASAAALYGSQAQNGVIMITTKSGGNKKIAVTFSSSETMSSIAYKPKFQNSYGQDSTSAMSPYSWGKKISSSNDNLDMFFQNGLNATNSISLSSGNEKAETYFSYANTSARGIQPTNKLQRNNFTFKQIGHFFDNKLTVEANIMYLTQTLNNSPYLGLYNNPLVGLYLFPRGVDLEQYKNNYISPQNSGFNRQNWLTQDPSNTTSTMTDEFGQNPWWIINKDPNVARRNRYIIGVTAKYKFNDWANLQVRGNVDRTTDNYEANYYQGSYQYINSMGNGALVWSEQTSQLKYADAILNLSQTNKSTPFQINGLIGTSINDYQMNGNANADNSGQGYTNLKNPDLFSIGNLYSAGGAVVFPFDSRYQIQSLFANANLSYKNLLYLTLTARNDWSSTLAFTNTNHFFYPSAGLSFVLSKLFNWDPATISFAKLRANYAIVGNGLTAFRSNPSSFFSGDGHLNVNTDAALNLKPEKTYSTELGLDLRFLNDRFNLSVTYYNTNTKNQYFYIQAPVESLQNYFSINAGNVRNRGLEFILGGNAIQNTHFTWSTSVNGSWINNKILELAPDYNIERYNLTGTNNFNFASLVTTGGKFGDIYGTKFAKDDQGRIKIGGDGTTTSPYTVSSENNEYLGNPMPKFTLGWSNDFTFNDITLHLLVDGKFGGHVLSATQAFLDQYGVSAVTGDARNNNDGMVQINGVSTNGTAITEIPADQYYKSVGGRGGIMENYIYSATVVRLREASVGYNFKLSPNAFFKKLRVSVFGRNLVYFSKKAPFDPEVTMSTGNGLSGVDLFGLPATRNVGLNFSLNF
ncbi:MAG: SusC/RagA family TonB-linked outer membrane protein [Pseudopedobacter saltans]|uniref:SusC/RagA family TonB-linked outer membrane protein n=1 Tax=Pseudopedobacter saltans TaxID=151895 RepID=A0A2W5FAK7_9SPHI|nr:MAG: SusC/RagA family TonB-linked outer membrane protein [Pseudopedobacter saltans]